MDDVAVPCPLCGAPIRIFEDAPQNWVPDWCKTGGCGLSSETFETREELETAFARRPPA